MTHWGFLAQAVVRLRRPVIRDTGWCTILDQIRS